jgi:predicted negative regulator of RcsB-dependent stress response
MENYGDRFANFYRIQYVIGVILGLIILFGSLWWYDHQQAEKMHRNLLINCLSSCIIQFQQTDEVAKEQCMDSCNKKYGEL